MKTTKSLPRRLVAACAIACAITCAMAASAAPVAPAVPPQVTAVATGGEWTSARAAGTLRVVLVDQGFEHVHSTLWLEWLAIGERTRPRLAARVLVKELSGGFAALRLDDRRGPFSGSQVRLRAANPYAPDDDREVTIEAGKPGQYRIVPAAATR